MADDGTISCELHDHLELACLRAYEIELSLRDGSRERGRATTTRTGADKTEYLCLAQGLSIIEVPTRSIAHLLVLTPNADFRELAF